MKVRDVMTREVVFVRPETSVGDVARLLVKYNISGVPVVENDKVIGIVTEEDLIMRDAIVDTPHVFSLFDSVFYLGSKKHFEEEMQKILATEASGLMSGRVVLISEEASVQELATLMMKKEVNPIPVVGPDGQLSGIVSRSDLIKLMVRELEEDETVGTTNATPLDDLRDEV
ncbi:MAG: CBS domain-containing protein [Chloroflexota bacterium]